MKYKVGDEVLVKARIIEVKEEENVQYKIKRCGNPVPYNFASGIYVAESDIVPDKDMTAEEAWEIAKKILLYPAHGGFNSAELEEIFGRTEHLWELTLQEAKAKIEAWKVEKDIKVGDEVVLKSDPDNNEYKFFVTYVDKGLKTIGGFSSFDGDVLSRREIGRYQKTGRHIDIEGILKQIGGNE